MKTTLVIDDHVMTMLRELAARERTTISALVEAALRRFLDTPTSDVPAELPPLPGFRGGPFLVDVSDRDALYEALERS